MPAAGFAIKSLQKLHWV